MSEPCTGCGKPATVEIELTGPEDSLEDGRSYSLKELEALGWRIVVRRLPENPPASPEKEEQP